MSPHNPQKSDIENAGELEELNGASASAEKISDVPESTNNEANRFERLRRYSMKIQQNVTQTADKIVLGHKGDASTEVL